MGCNEIPRFGPRVGEKIDSFKNAIPIFNLVRCEYLETRQYWWAPTLFTFSPLYSFPPLGPTTNPDPVTPPPLTLFCKISITHHLPKTLPPHLSHRIAKPLVGYGGVSGFLCWQAK